MTLNNENEMEVRGIVDEAMNELGLLRQAESRLAVVRQEVNALEDEIATRTRRRAAHNRAIEALGFHDIGHARTEMTTFRICTVCGERTDWACSDCAIDSGGRKTVYVCNKTACRDAHEAIPRHKKGL